MNELNLKTVFDAYQLPAGQAREDAINKTVADNQNLLKTWLDAHPGIENTSPLFKDLKNRVRPMSRAEALLNAPLALFRTAQHYLVTNNDSTIENILLSKDLGKLKEYFSKNPGELFNNADLIKMHLSLKTISFNEFLTILSTAAENLQDIEHPILYPPFIETEKRPSLIRLFSKEIKHLTRFNLADIIAHFVSLLKQNENSADPMSSQSQFLQLLKELSDERKPKLVISLLSQLQKSPDLLISLLSKEINRNGNIYTPLHSGITFERLLPWLKTLAKDSPELLISLMSIRRPTALMQELPLEDPIIFEKALPWLQTLAKESPDLLISLLTIKPPHSLATSPLDDPKIFKIALPLLNILAKESPDDLISLLSNKKAHDRKGFKTMLHDVESFKIALPWLHTLAKESPELLISLLSIKKGMRTIPLHYTPLHYPHIFEIALPWLQLLSVQEPDLVKRILSIETSTGEAVRSVNENSEAARSLLELLPEGSPDLAKDSSDLLVSLLSIRDRSGLTPLHSRFAMALPWLKTLSPDILRRLFSIKDAKGNTPLSIEENFKAAKSWLLTLPHDSPILEVEDQDGFSLNFLIGRSLPLSTEWLLHGKKSFTEVPKLTEDEYAQKVQAVTTDLDTLWNRLSFGTDEGQVNPSYLFVNAKDESAGTHCTPEAIKEKLDEMVRKIRVKEAWLGTPKADKPDELHVFYCEMLTNFETLLNELKNKANPAEVAGPLIDIGKVELQGRCAAGYQSEIEQKRYLAASDFSALTVDELVNKLVTAILREVIETIVRNHFHSDSHYSTQFLYSVGLASQPDPLTQMTPDACANWVLDEWTPATVLMKLRDSLKTLDQEQMQEWIKKQTPDDFNSELVLLGNRIKTEEAHLIEKRDAKLKELSISTDDFKKLTDRFNEAAFAARRVKPDPKYDEKITARKTEIEQMTKEQDSARAEFDPKKAVILQNALNMKVSAGGENTLTPKERAAALENSKEYQPLKVLNAKAMNAKRALDSLEKGRKAQTALQEDLRKLVPNLSDSDLNKILAIKAEFDTGIDAIIDQHADQVHAGVEVSFNLSDECYPSRGVDNTRRIAYAKQFFNAGEKGLSLNYKGHVKILDSIGVMETAAQLGG